MSLPVERASEAVARKTKVVDVLVYARHGGDGYIGVQQDCLARVIRSVPHALGERVPVGGGSNMVRLPFGDSAVKQEFGGPAFRSAQSGKGSAAAVEHDSRSRKNGKQYRRCDNDNRSAYDFYANGFMLHKGSPLCPPRRRKAPGVFVPRSAAKMKSVIRPYQTDATRSYA